MEEKVHSVLIFGHSFVRRLAHDLDRSRIERGSKTFDVREIVVHMHGVGGRTVKKLLDFDLSFVAKLKPEIIILEIGSNDLACNKLRPEVVGSQIEELVVMLHERYAVEVIAVSACIHRQKCEGDFNHKVDVLNQYLRVVLEPLGFAFFFKHRGLHNPAGAIHAKDGVHLNLKGEYLLYRSYRGAILTALRRLGGNVNNN